MTDPLTGYRNSDPYMGRPDFTPTDDELRDIGTLRQTLSVVDTAVWALMKLPEINSRSTRITTPGEVASELMETRKGIAGDIAAISRGDVRDTE